MSAAPADRCVCTSVGLVYAICRVHHNKPPWAKGNLLLNQRRLRRNFGHGVKFRYLRNDEIAELERRILTRENGLAGMRGG